VENDLIIDAHVHTYPTATIGQQALQGMGQTGCSGTVGELLSVMARGKISLAVLANMTPTYDMKVATLKNLPASTPQAGREKAEKEINEKVIDRMKRRNLWSCTSARENPVLVPLISIDLLQTPTDMQAEIEDKVKNHGAKGLKLHPVSNRFYPYDRSLWPAYQKATEMGLPILFHSGKAEIAGYTQADYARPGNFEQVLQSFPKLVMILAHLGNGFLEESVALAQKYDNVCFDTSAILSGMGVKSGFASGEEAVKLIRTIGVSRVLFGSDWPWFDPLLAIGQIEGLGFSEEEKRRILGLNAAKVFGLRPPPPPSSSLETVL
jgi:predicted TIM-barrel fold metal-dependent hydrolase